MDLRVDIFARVVIGNFDCVVTEVIIHVNNEIDAFKIVIHLQRSLVFICIYCSQVLGILEIDHRVRVEVINLVDVVRVVLDY